MSEFEGLKISVKTKENGKPCNHATQDNVNIGKVLQKANISPSFLTAKDVSQLQRTIGNRAVCQLLSKQPVQATTNNKVIQRVVLNMDAGDQAIVDAARIAKERQAGSLKRDVESYDTTNDILRLELLEPIRFIDVNEPLTILAHGLPAIGDDEPMVANLTAQQLYNKLKSFGLTKAFKGEINLSNCTTAWNRGGQPSFAERFENILVQNGHKNVVTGFKSFVASVDNDTETEIAYDQREQALATFMCDRYMMLLNDYTSETSTEKRKALKEQLKTGSALLIAEVKKQLIGLHNDTYSDVYMGLYQMLSPFSESENYTDDGLAMNLMEKIMILKTKTFGKKPIKKVKAEKEYFGREELLLTQLV